MGEVCFAGRVRSRSLAAAGTLSSRSHESRINQENGVLFSTDIDISFSVHLPREPLKHCSNYRLLEQGHEHARQQITSWESRATRNTTTHAYTHNHMSQITNTTLLYFH